MLSYKNKLFVLSFSPLSFALISQYFFDMHPCEMCIYQRIPLYIILGISILLYFIDTKKLTKYILLFCVLLFLVSLGLASYHVGIEQGWWQTGCSSDLKTSSIDELRAQIYGAPVVRCDEVQFHIFGLSMAGMNVLYSIFCAIIIFIDAKNYRYDAKN